MRTLEGRLPDNAKDLQDKVPGIGRYSAGAICSIAYGERVPVLDGNVHRLLSRFLAVHAQPKAKSTLDLLWEAAAKLVQVGDSPEARDLEAKEDSATEMARTRYPGDINQALIELGSTVCKVRDPQCDTCPLRKWCCAYELTNGMTDGSRRTGAIPDMEGQCTLCEPIPGEHAVTIYPMRVDRKKAREELDIVNVIEWCSSPASKDRWFLLVRRPENGLLAGLYEFPTSADVSKSISSAAILKQTNDWLLKTLRTELQPVKPYQSQDNNVSKSEACRVKHIISAVGCPGGWPGSSQLNVRNRHEELRSVRTGLGVYERRRMDSS
ncbi:hypothetical protein AX15_001531 [Amanita polypyramis BW_CC]|nr:hypothetical protein AX15_001531 [Amanita polypyramis BW_CC]